MFCTNRVKEKKFRQNLDFENKQRGLNKIIVSIDRFGTSVQCSNCESWNTYRRGLCFLCVNCEAVINANDNAAKNVQRGAWENVNGVYCKSTRYLMKNCRTQMNFAPLPLSEVHSILSGNMKSPLYKIGRQCLVNRMVKAGWVCRGTQTFEPLRDEVVTSPSFYITHGCTHRDCIKY